MLTPRFFGSLLLLPGLVALVARSLCGRGVFRCDLSLVGRISLVLTPCLVFALLVPTQLSWAADAETQRPNIIIILVDDMGYSDIGCYGGEIETPHLDGLAAGGLRMTQFYNSGRCCPTRASLMTGRHPHQVGIGHMTEPPERTLGFEGVYQGNLNDECVTVAQVLRSAGYRTFMTGKWHLGYHSQDDWPLQRGFDKYFGGIAGAFNYFKPDEKRGMTRGNEPADVEDGFYATDAFTDVACEYISEACEQDDEKPFFLYLAYNAPHWPLNSKWEEFQKYRGKYKEGWEALMRSRLAKQKEIGLFPESIVPAPHVGPKWESLNEKQRDDLDAIMAAYAGCIDSIDQNIGKLVAHLESLDERENTVIFFLSDNGACQEGGDLGRGSEEMVRNPPSGTGGVRQGLAWANASNTPFRLYKHFVHEGGACTPMIASWPAGIPKSKAGGYVRQFAYLPDFMATCIDLSDADYPADLPPCEGESLVLVLKGGEQPVHNSPVYWEHEGNAAMRSGDWKLVREYKRPWELYNLANDRAEMNDLATSMSDKRDALIAQWEQWATKNQVAFPERFNMYEHLKKLKDREQAAQQESSKSTNP